MYMKRASKMSKLTVSQTATGDAPIVLGSHGSSASSRVVLPSKFSGLEDEIECPVCSDFLIGPVRMCIRGHSICQKCIDIVSYCPLCRKEMSQVRNYFLEFFMDNCVFKCKYNDQGCSTELTSVDYYRHTEQCHFREVTCSTVTYDACEMISNFKDFITHLSLKHKIQTFVNGKKYCFHFPRDKGKIFQTPYASIEYDGKMFFYNFATYRVSAENAKTVTLALWWVSYVNPTLDSTKYRCRIKICSWKDKDLIMSWSGPVLDFRVSAEKVLMENQCLNSTLAGLKKFCSDDDNNPLFVFSHVESAEIFKMGESECPNYETGHGVTILESESFRY